jgi:hypothetical protein
MDIHENILKMVTILVSELNNKENELTIYKSKQHIGLNIDNFVTTYNFNNNVMRERIIMFITYIEFFHKLHTKYLKRFSKKIQLIYTDINNDIKFDESLEISSSSSSKVKTINQYNIVDSENESNKLNRINKILSMEKDSGVLSDSSSISSKSDENIPNIQISSNDDNLDKLDENDGIDLDNSVSDEEMNELFLNIESSCKSIINKNNDNHEVEVINKQLTQENNDKIESNDNPDNIEFKIEEKEEIQKEEKEEIQKEEKEEYNDEIKEESSVIESDPEPETKKKRTYKPRKKKV